MFTSEAAHVFDTGPGRNRFGNLPCIWCAVAMHDQFREDDQFCAATSGLMTVVFHRSQCLFVLSQQTVHTDSGYTDRLHQVAVSTLGKSELSSQVAGY